MNARKLNCNPTRLKMSARNPNRKRMNPRISVAVGQFMILLR
jgi:hypothetical protein